MTKLILHADAPRVVPHMLREGRAVVATLRPPGTCYDRATRP